MPNTRYLIPALILAIAATIVLAACGGSGSSTTGEVSSTCYIVKSSDPISTTTNKPSVPLQSAEVDNDEVSPTGAAPVRPCDLVSKGEASAILGAPVLVTTGPQGPTCIYETPGSKQVMTLVVERISLPSLRNQAKTAKPVSVAGRDGWCLRYGSTSLAVPLGEGSVLDITGPCNVATQFAAHALPHIAS
jgi:hypothetical protein